MARTLGLSLVLALALGVLAAPTARADENNPHAGLIGKPAPDFQGDFAVKGKPVKLSDLKGKVVLVDFWAVWCPPCVRAFPHLREIHEKYNKDGLEVVGLTKYYKRNTFDKTTGRLGQAPPGQPVNQQDEQTLLKAYAAHHRLYYAITTLPDEDARKVFTAYGVRGIPQPVVIDKKGNIRLVKVGFSEANMKQVEAMVQKLLKE